MYYILVTKFPYVYNVLSFHNVLALFIFSKIQ